MNALLNRFLWQGGTVWVALSTCTQSTYCGGIAAADIQVYYWASQLLVINEWWYGSQGDPAYAVERFFMADAPLLHHLYSSSSLEAFPPACRTVIQIWRRVVRSMGWWGRLTGATPLWQGSRLRPVSSLEGFRRWDDIGISTLGDIIQGSTLKSFQRLQADFDLHKSQFHRYLLLCHALSPPDTTSHVFTRVSPTGGPVTDG